MEEGEEEVECTRTCLPMAAEVATIPATSSHLPWVLAISTLTKVACAEEVNNKTCRDYFCLFSLFKLLVFSINQ